MRQLISRRRFVTSSITAGAAVAIGSRFSWAQPNGGSALRVRPSASELAPDDPVFAQYAAAVSAMHALPQTDPRNWINQAKIHADRCPHGGRGFLPWHRHYINFFEQICGQLLDDNSFALPYWDWSHGSGIIPDAFFDIPELNVEHWDDPGQYDSSIPGGWTGIDTVGRRAIGRSVGVQSDPVRGGAFTSGTINSILGETQFRRFTGRIEGSPHNSGHVVVGFLPDAIGHIGSGLSPLDPLFWLHHCNVDRLWAQWQLAGNQTPSMADEYNGHFVDATGQSVNVRATDAQDFSALGYTYDQFASPRNLIAMAGLADPNAPADAPILEALRTPRLENVVRQLGSV